MTFDILGAIDTTDCAPTPCVRGHDEIAGLHRALLQRATDLTPLDSRLTAYLTGAAELRRLKQEWRLSVEPLEARQDDTRERMRDSANEALKALVAAIQQNEQVARDQWFDLAKAWREDIALQA